MAIINFLKTFKEACDSNGVPEGIATRMFQYYLKGTPRSSLRKDFKSRGKDKSKRKKDLKSHKVTTYTAIVQMLLQTYANDEVLSEAHASVTDYKKPSNMHPISFANKLSDRAERTGDVFPDETLREVFIMALQSSIRGYVRSHLSRHPKLSLQELARYAANVDNMQSNRSSPSPNIGGGKDSTDKPANIGDSRSRRRSGSTNSGTPSAPTAAATDRSVTALSVSSGDYLDEILVADMAAAPQGRAGQYHTCRVCLGNNHDTSKCKYLNAAMTPEFMKVRETNYARIAKARRSGSSSRQSNKPSSGSTPPAPGATTPAPGGPSTPSEN